MIEHIDLCGKQANSIKAIFEHKNGILGSEPPVSFSYSDSKVDFTIAISQAYNRTIEITANNLVDASVLWELLLEIEKLSMLFDGEFLKFDCAEFLIDGNKEEWSDELVNDYVDIMLHYYTSANYTSSGSCKFICPLKVISGNLLTEWISLEQELDIIHPMILYCMADTGMTVDFKCIMLIESCKAMTGIAKKKDKAFKPSVNRRTPLKDFVKIIISQYGSDIFADELHGNIDKISKVLADSRNRIDHLKSKKNQDFLSGDESVIYAAKLSMLYRHILLEVLGVDYSLYRDTLLKKVKGWDQHQGILANFINTKGR